MFSQYRAAIESWFVVGLVLALVIGVQAYQKQHPGSPTDGVRLTGFIGNSHRTLAPGPFRGGEVSAVMAGTELDLRQTTIEPGSEMEVDVLAFWGSITIRVPEGWTVDTRTAQALGQVRDQRLRPFDALDTPVGTSAPAPRLVIHGAIVMGGLVIKS